MTPLYCESEALTNCLGITTQQCVQASDMALELCSSTYGLDTMDTDVSDAILMEAAKCAANQIWHIASVSQETFKACQPQFIKAINTEVERIKKQREKSDQEFHKPYVPPKVY